MKESWSSDEPGFRYDGCATGFADRRPRECQLVGDRCPTNEGGRKGGQSGKLWEERKSGSAEFETKSLDRVGPGRTMKGESVESRRGY